MTCPVRGKPARHRLRPFCSERRADLDLGKWLKGDYALPSRDPEDTERAAAEAARQRPKPH